jgi:phosphoglycerate dehydrogenase-like enzyme
MGKYSIQYIGSAPEFIVKKLYSKLPPGFELKFLNTSKTRILDLEKADFLMGFLRNATISTEEFDVLSRVKLIQLLGAGYDNIDINKATKLGIPVANNGGANAVTVAEHTILLILTLYRKLYKYSNEYKKGVWFREKDHPLGLFELANKKIGIIGLGNIGKELSKRLKGFKTSIYYYDIIRYKKEEDILGLKYVSLEDLLKTSDIISLHVPLLKSTIKMIGKRELSLMKKSAILINTSRGEVIDEDSLVDSLKNKEIAGAGLDVLARESEIQDGNYVNPLLNFENVVVTPHYAGHSFDTYLRRIDVGYSNIVRTARGLEPEFVVNREVFG